MTHQVKIDGKECDDAFTILKTLKEDHTKLDHEDVRNLEFCLVLSNQAMHPITGVRIYPYTVDEELVKEWRKKLDYLFIKIKKDIEQETK